jgi:hypothetical protein
MAQTLKLGKHPPSHDTRTLQFGVYKRASLPPPPASVTWERKIPDDGWGMMGNDVYCDCTCAAAGHMIRQWTADSGHGVIIPDKEILAFYGHFSGGNPQRGADMLSVLRYWRKAGLASHSIDAFVGLALKNVLELKEAVCLFGAAYIGLGLPAFAVPQGEPHAEIPWVVPAKGAVGDAAPSSNHGHCVPVVAYDAQGLYVVTWGRLKTMSWQFYSEYTEEAFAVLSPDWFKKGSSREAPSGFDVAGLKRDLAKLTKT